MTDGRTAETLSLTSSQFVFDLIMVECRLPERPRGAISRNVARWLTWMAFEASRQWQGMCVWFVIQAFIISRIGLRYIKEFVGGKKEVGRICLGCWGNWQMWGRWLETVLVSDIGDGVGLAIISDEAE
jgi:hypothetical protein